MLAYLCSDDAYTNYHTITNMIEIQHWDKYKQKYEANRKKDLVNEVEWVDEEARMLTFLVLLPQLPPSSSSLSLSS